MSIGQRAKREAFLSVSETCPAVDRALDEAARSIKEQTMALRDALIEALERALLAEDRVSELEVEVAKLERRLEDQE